MSSDPRRIVEAALQSLNDHDLDGYYALCADDFRYVGTEERRGKAEARAVDEPVFAAVPDHWRRFDQVIVSGDTVVVWGTFGGTVAATGKSFEVEACNVIEVRDDLIQSLTMYADWSGLTDAFTP
jgi:ketosteroid isomerase-like protein